MSAANSTTMIGNLTAEPELRYTSTGRPVTNIRIAVNEVSFVNGERRERTEYVNVVVWNAMAENCAASLSTGTRVVVIGRYQNRTAEIDGTKRYFPEVVADEVALALRWAQVEPDSITKHNGKDSVPVAAGAPADDSADDGEPF